MQVHFLHAWITRNLRSHVVLGHRDLKIEIHEQKQINAFVFNLHSLGGVLYALDWLHLGDSGDISMDPCIHVICDFLCHERN